jgi:DNA-binding MarR family transcriptional regulator
MTTGELAVRERIKPPSVSRSSHALVEMGLLERVPHATDRRQVVLTLTDSGRAVADSDVAERERVLAERLGELSDDERTTLAEAARILTEIVEKNE